MEENIHIVSNFVSREFLDEIRPLFADGLDSLNIDNVSNREVLSPFEIAKLEAAKAHYGNNIFKLPHAVNGVNAELYEIVSKHIVKDQICIESVFGDLQPETKFNITVMLKGSSVPPHTDEQIFPEHVGTINKTVLRDITSVFYLNDDFDGGELYFDCLNKTIKPEAGMLVFFPTAKIYRHAVLTVRNGQRFSVSRFWNFKSS